VNEVEYGHYGYERLYSSSALVSQKLDGSGSCSGADTSAKHHNETPSFTITSSYAHEQLHINDTTRLNNLDSAIKPGRDATHTLARHSYCHG